LQLAQSTSQSRERSLYITQRRFEAGIDSRSPSLQAEASLENARLAVLTAQTSLLKAQNALELLIGGSVPAELMPDAAVTGIVSEKVFNAGLPSELLYYRPDIAQAEYSLKAAGANIDVARAAFFPTIALSSSMGLSSGSLNNLFSTNGVTWSFGPSVSIPIFDGGVLNANYEVAQIAQRESLAGYEYAIQNAFKEVRDVLAERATMGEQLNSQYRLQENYQRTYDIAYATFRSGLANYLDVLDAERSLFNNQQGILNLEQQRVISQISLYQVLGGGATLTAPQITGENRQERAMTSAAIATDEQIDELQPIFGTPAKLVDTSATANATEVETNTATAEAAQKAREVAKEAAERARAAAK
ncbi:MAG: efflux transporter outer membrane subunit, partial [Moraxella sp.]|nr:efflux transporter outer membrane subunit [Moraxella sp.]